MNRIQELGDFDLRRLITFHSALSLIPSYGINPTYNLPIALYGLYAYEQHDSTFHIKQFIYLLAISILLDIFWLIGWTGSIATPKWILLPLIIINLILKPVTLLSAVQALRLRGDEFRFGGVGADNLPGWAAPASQSAGAGSGQGGYQSLGGDLEDGQEQDSAAPPAFTIGGTTTPTGSKKAPSDKYQVIE